VIRAPARIAVLAALALAASALAADPEPGPGYLPAVREELARLGLGAVCDEVRGACSFAAPRPDGGEFRVGVRLVASQATIYLFIERFLELEDPQGPSLELSRRLLDLNRQLVVGKFEWDRGSNAIRLSAQVPCDSNFDRAAFRSTLTGLLAAAARLWPGLGARSRS
jgi:hypothetical protein